MLTSEFLDFLVVDPAHVTVQLLQWMRDETRVPNARGAPGFSHPG